MPSGKPSDAALGGTGSIWSILVMREWSVNRVSVGEGVMSCTFEAFPFEGGVLRGVVEPEDPYHAA